MTLFQKTKDAYQKGNKEMAYLAFLTDPTANKNVSFEQFCKGFDKMISQENTKTTAPKN